MTSGLRAVVAAALVIALVAGFASATFAACPGETGQTLGVTLRGRWWNEDGVKRSFKCLGLMDVFADGRDLLLDVDAACPGQVAFALVGGFLGRSVQMARALSPINKCVINARHDISVDDFGHLHGVAKLDPTTGAITGEKGVLQYFLDSGVEAIWLAGKYKAK